jgi:excisionase family DNA binding protein
MKDAIVVLTAEQLKGVIAEAVESALAKAGARQDHDVLSREQAAELIGVHPHTIPKLVREDGLPTLRRLGKLWRFSRADVMAWLARRRG